MTKGSVPVKETLQRRAADGPYFHPDFHGALSCGIEYLHQHFGENAVREYLYEFACTFYAPLRQALRRDGLAVLKEHFENLYRLEGGTVELELTPDALTVRVAACPAVQHMRSRGYPVARLFHETTRTVNAALCTDTPYAAELLDYDPQTGRSIQRFRRRVAAFATPDSGGQA